MRSKRVLTLAVLFGFAGTLGFGCAESANPEVAPSAPAAKAEPSKEAPKAAPKAVGGAGSSGASGKNPAASS